MRVQNSDDIKNVLYTLGPQLPRICCSVLCNTTNPNPNENYTDSTNIKKRRQRKVGMGCTNWDAGLTSSDISVSLSITMPARTSSAPCFSGKSLQSLLPQALGSLLATPTSCWHHRIGPTSAFPQQLLQVSRTLSLLPPTFPSTKTNEPTYCHYY